MSLRHLYVNQQNKEAVHVLKEFLLCKSDENNQMGLLSLLLHQLNIEITSIRKKHQNSNIPSRSLTNHNNSYSPYETEDLSALYAQYQIDPILYPPPNLQFSPHETAQTSYYHPSLSSPNFTRQPRMNGSSNSRRSGDRKGRRHIQKRKHSRWQKETDLCNRNTITVRQISCEDRLDPQILLENRLEQKQKKLKKKIKSTRSLKVSSIDDKRVYTDLKMMQPPSCLVKVQPSPVQSITSKVFTSSSVANNTTKTPMPSVSTVWQLCQKPSNVTIKGSSTSSISAELRDSVSMQTDFKATAVVTRLDTLDSQVELESRTLDTDRRSSTTSSIVPHFSSTLAPQIPAQIPSSPELTTPSILSIRAMSDVSTPEPVISSPAADDNIQALVDQLKKCLTTVGILLQDKMDHGKQAMTSADSRSETKTNKSQKRQSQLSSSSSSSSTSPQMFSRLQRRFSHDKNNLVYEDITVRQCAPREYQKQEEEFEEQKIPHVYDDRYDKLKRCLLVYYRDRANENSNENLSFRSHAHHQYRRDNRKTAGYKSYGHRYSSWNHSAWQYRESSSQYDECTTSKSILFLAEEDDEYEELLRSVASLK